MPQVRENTIEITEFLSEMPPFSFLEEKVLKDVAGGAKTAHFPEGTYIFREGERSKKTLYIVYRGQAKSLVSIGGDETVTTVRNRGDFFGITVLLTDEPYPISMLASKDLTCLLISRKLFHEALSSSERFADYFTKILASRLKELYQTITDNYFEGRIDSGQSLKRKIAEILTEKVITCLPMDTISKVAKKMAEYNVSSVVVTAFNGKPVGIITEKDMVNKVLSADKPDLEQRAHKIMSHELITVQPNDFSYQALLMMTKHNIQHVVVTDDNDVLHGIVTVKDLIRNRESGAISIVRQIEHQDSFSGLAALIKEVDQVEQALITDRAFASEICALVNELYDRIIRKMVRLSELELESSGLGLPPVKYCFINMGSGGRKEQYSRSDQDNGIIYEDSTGDLSVLSAEYFLTLGRLIVKGLEECGFKRCAGDVMAENPAWCKPLSAWKADTLAWVDKLDPKDIRNMTIFLDYRPITGDIKLYEDLKIFTADLFKKSRHALQFLAEDDLRQHTPLNLFRQIITGKSSKDRNKLNLKNAVMVHLVDCLRIFALREGINETNSFERIQKLKERGVFKVEDAEYIEAAYETLMMFRIRNALEKVKAGKQPDNLINLKTLSKKEMTMLKESLLVVNRLQSLTMHAFHAHKA
ncbi:MAG: DUF294 nucleotidyltransferase-like domain-containing protein [Bacillota bacterium]|nr:DUF294 nucleotidyltransferase-like domain-containing protein [Bacillota bacterium]